MPDRSLLTEYGAAELLGITPERVRRLVKSGVIPYVVLPGNIRRFSPEDLRGWVTTHRRPATEELATR